MKIYLVKRPPRPPRQLEFRFLERSRRLERRFKRMILVATLALLAGIIGASSWGRYGVAAAGSEARQVVRWTLGLPRPRDEVDSDWRRFRELGIEESRRALGRVYAGEDPAMQRLLRYSGLDPDHGVLRWGNYNLTLLLPSKVFEADDEGRSYRLRPNVRSIWLRELTIKSGTLMFFLVPDGPGLSEAIRGTRAIPVETSRQTTNSWGLRGPEPDPDAPVRGVVLGDSYMQGLFIGDDETPPECLRRYLQRELKTRVSVLNTGVLGYSPEQYYYTLEAFGERFRPHFVVVSIFTNDFGDLHEVPTNGRGDWEEGKYWLDRILEYCRSRRWTTLIVAAPYKPSMFGKPKTGFYPGMIANILDVNGLTFLDPTDDFINAHLGRIVDGEEKGDRPQGCPLFNESIGDGHFSPAGSEVWAESAGRRLVLLMKMSRVLPPPSSHSHHEKAPDPPLPRTTTRPGPTAPAGVLREGDAS